MRRAGPGRSARFPSSPGLLVSMLRDFLAGRVGVDAIAFVSMTAALLLGENLAGIVVAVMYAGGNVLEDFAVARAERDLKSLVDRAPRVAHRRSAHGPRRRAGRRGRGRRCRSRARRRDRPDRRHRHQRRRRHRRGGVDRRADPGDAADRRAGAERHAQCRRDLRDARDRDGGREHLCRHRAHGGGGADRQGALHPPRRPLCAAAAAGDARGRRARPGSSPAIPSAASR